jgi:hypothetical protein
VGAHYSSAHRAHRQTLRPQASFLPLQPPSSKLQAPRLKVFTSLRASLLGTRNTLETVHGYLVAAEQNVKVIESCQFYFILLTRQFGENGLLSYSYERSHPTTSTTVTVTSPDGGLDIQYVLTQDATPSGPYFQHLWRCREYHAIPSLCLSLHIWQP